MLKSLLVGLLFVVCQAGCVAESETFVLKHLKPAQAMLMLGLYGTDDVRNERASAWISGEKLSLSSGCDVPAVLLQDIESVTPDDSGNTLILSGDKSGIAKISSLISALDVQQKNVQLEVETYRVPKEPLWLMRKLSGTIRGEQILYIGTVPINERVFLNTRLREADIKMVYFASAITPNGTKADIKSKKSIRIEAVLNSEGKTKSAESSVEIVSKISLIPRVDSGDNVDVDLYMHSPGNYNGGSSGDAPITPLDAGFTVMSGNCGVIYSPKSNILLIITPTVL